MRRRYQNGCIWLHKKSKTWHVKYYVTEFSDENGKAVPGRVQKSEFLCKKDAEHFSKKCPAVQKLAAKVMARVNSEQGTTQEQEMLITDFWESVFLPHYEKKHPETGVLLNAKPSTLDGWKKIWGKPESPISLAREFAGITLKQYRKTQADALLTRLADEGYGLHTINHVHSLARRLFGFACRRELITGNPWEYAESETRLPDPVATHAYTLEEAQAIFNVLEDEPEARLMFVFAMFNGLRPGEISGLKWEDFEGKGLRIHRSVWRGHEGTPKTKATKQDGTPEQPRLIPMLSQVRGLLEQWRALSGNPVSGWVFPQKDGALPKSAENTAFKIIKPACESAGLKWYGLYSARRGAATALKTLTGNAMASQYVLRHAKAETTEQFYIKTSEDAAIEGMAKLEEKISDLKLLPASVRPEKRTAQDAG